jgi:RNA polymerase sigma-70 factor (ECF subfamily)
VTEADDNLLVGKVLAGDTEAYRALVERHRARIFYLGLKFFHNHEEAEDFCQDLFLRAFEKLRSFRGRVPFSAWLYRVAFNLAVNRYHVNRRGLAETDLDVQIPDRRASLEGSFEKEELRQSVRKILAGLPDGYNLAIRMHYFDGLSYPEISRATGIPVGTLKSHIFRAKRLIRRALTGGSEEQEHGNTPQRQTG